MGPIFNAFADPNGFLFYCASIYQRVPYGLRWWWAGSLVCLTMNTACDDLLDLPQNWISTDTVSFPWNIHLVFNECNSAKLKLVGIWREE